MKEARTEVHDEIDEITAAGVVEAVISFFDGVNLATPGVYSRGNKQIEVIRDKENEVLSARATVNGVDRAIIRSYYGRVFSAYFRLQGEEDAHGVRDDIVYNRGIYGGGSVNIFRGPGVDLSQKELKRRQAERLEIAGRLGIKLNVPPPQETRILK